jgi:hypothetical protein
MTASNKRSTKKKIEGMAPKDITNLWGGIQTGLDLFDKDPNGRVPALMVLTDGMPNHMYDLLAQYVFLVLMLTILQVPLYGLCLQAPEHGPVASYPSHIWIRIQSKVGLVEIDR